MNKKLLAPLMVFVLLVSAMTVNAGNIGTAVTDIVTTLDDFILVTLNITMPVDDNARYGSVDVGIAYTTANVSGGATKTYSLNGGINVTLPDSPFAVTGVDNGLTDGGTLNNITINIEDINGTVEKIRYFKVDITPPGQIDTIVSAKGINYINWTWVNPSNTDFNNTIVNVTNATGTVIPDTKLPKTINYFNATGLKPNTAYTISVKTEDDAPLPIIA